MLKMKTQMVQWYNGTFPFQSYSGFVVQSTSPFLNFQIFRFSDLYKQLRIMGVISLLFQRYSLYLQSNN